jgi:hypothetical protein
MGNSFSHCKAKGVDVSIGVAKKRNGGVMGIRGVINTPSVPGENAPSTSRQVNNVVSPLDFLIELGLHNFFSWATC